VRIRAIAVVGVVTVGVLAGCSSGSDDSGSSSSSTSTTAAKAEKLTILVGNDDGYAADGIDAVVEALRKLPDVEVTVSAPAENKSGTGSSTTPGTLTATEQKTKSGYPAFAVDGFPADGITYGLSQMQEKPKLVVTGINQGQNLGASVAISGTVGAAKVAAAQGIPAIAASQGIATTMDYTTAAQYVVDWLTAHRAQLVAGKAGADVVNLNVPTCPTGSVRGLKQEPVAASGNGIVPATNCESTETEFTDDVQAFVNGFATVSQLDAQGQTVTSSTTWPAAG
jgi:5'-nucleotidase